MAKDTAGGKSGQLATAMDGGYDQGYADGYADCRDTQERRPLAGLSAEYVNGYVEGWNDRCEDESSSWVVEPERVGAAAVIGAAIDQAADPSDEQAAVLAEVGVEGFVLHQLRQAGWRLVHLAGAPNAAEVAS